MINDFFFVIKFFIELFDFKLFGYIILVYICKKFFFFKEWIRVKWSEYVRIIFNMFGLKKE